MIIKIWTTFESFCSLLYELIWFKLEKYIIKIYSHQSFLKMRWKIYKSFNAVGQRLQIKFEIIMNHD